MAKRKDHDLLCRLGARFRAIRVRMGRTQEEVAEALEIQPTTLSRWETGKSGLSLPLLAQAADYFGVDLGELVRQREDQELGPEEAALVGTWRKLDDEQKGLILGMMGQMVGKGRRP